MKATPAWRPGDRPDAVIAIPVRNEAARIGRCLDALKAQAGGFEVVLLFNNCEDESREAARAAQRELPYRLHFVEARLEGERAHVGWARRLAMDAAADLLGDGGIILTTDADSRPVPGWLAANRAAIRAGADAVAGIIVPDPAERRGLPSLARRRLWGQRRYERLMERLTSLLDPEAHDPWPRHGYHCGASMAVRLDAYRRVGGLPPEPSSEDRAFFAAVLRQDGRVRHCPKARVVTSCRLNGRAAGGMADTLLRWSEAREGEGIPAAWSVARAARLRAALRRAWRTNSPAAFPALTPAALADAIQAPTFGLALECAAHRLPALTPRLVPAARLPEEIAAALRLAVGLEGGTSSARRDRR